MDGTEENHNEIALLKPNRVIDLISYEEGSIISKTIVDKKSTSVTIFAFDKFQEIIGHTLPYDALFFVLEGLAEVSIEGKVSNVKEGEIISFPANKTHAISAKSKFKMLLISIKE